MNINVTTICEIDEKKLLERLKKEGHQNSSIEILELAISTAIQNVLKQHVEDDIIKIRLSTVPAHPSIEGSVECTVNYISDTYLIRGDNQLCKDLKSKIGLQAKVFG